MKNANEVQSQIQRKPKKWKQNREWKWRNEKAKEIKEGKTHIEKAAHITFTFLYIVTEKEEVVG